MPKDKKLLVESGKWHSKENQLVKHPRRPQKGVMKRDVKQRSIKSFCVKLHQKPVEQDKENQNADMIQYKLAPSPHHQLKSMNMVCTPTTAFPSVGNHGALTCTVPDSIIKYDEEACLETQKQSHKSEMAGRSQPVFDGIVSIETNPTSTKRNRLQTVTIPLLEDALDNFCPMHTSTQISAIHFNGHTGSESQDCSCVDAESQASPHADDRDESNQTILKHRPPMTRGSCNDASRYNLSMRFTQDSLGNPIFCRFSQKD